MGLRSPLLKSFGDDFAWSLLDAAPDATLVVSSAGEIVFVNDHAGTLFGFELDDLLGKVVEDLLPETLRAVHRAHRTRYRAEPTVRSMGADLDLVRAAFDGSMFPVEISLSPLRLGDDVYVVAAVRDITERVESEDRLHRVLQTLDASDDAMFMFDADTLRFAFVNQGAVRLMGYSAAGTVDDDAVAPQPVHDRGRLQRCSSMICCPTRRSATVRQATMLRKDGSEVAVEKTYRAAPAGRDGHRWVITMARDISSRLAAEAALRQSHQALHDAEQVVAIAEDRERIARDLHDTVIQRLFGEGLKLLATMNTVDDAGQAAHPIDDRRPRSDDQRAASRGVLAAGRRAATGWVCAVACWRRSPRHRAASASSRACSSKGRSTRSTTPSPNSSSQCSARHCRTSPVTPRRATFVSRRRRRRHHPDRPTTASACPTR